MMRVAVAMQHMNSVIIFFMKQKSSEDVETVFG